MENLSRTELSMTSLGFFQRNFVLWGEIGNVNGSYYQPYIILARLASLSLVVALRKAGEIQEILKMLRLYVRDYKKFVNSKDDEIYELKDRLKRLTGLK